MKYKLLLTLCFSMLFCSHLMAQTTPPASDSLTPNYCPVFSIAAERTEVWDGDKVILKAKVENYSDADAFIYHWQTTAGTISETKDSTEAELDTAGMGGVTAIVSYEVSSKLSDECPRTATTQVTVLAQISGDPLDSIPDIPYRNLMARLDAAAVAFHGWDKQFNIYFVVTNSTRKSRNYAKRWFTRTKNYLVKNRDIAPNRIKFIEGCPRRDFQAVIWIGPADNPPGAPPCN